MANIPPTEEGWKGLLADSKTAPLTDWLPDNYMKHTQLSRAKDELSALPAPNGTAARNKQA